MVSIQEQFMMAHVRYLERQTIGHFFWFCADFNKIQNKGHHNRNSFRDNGIVISISVIQWIVEVLHMTIFYLYSYMKTDYTNIIDQFFNLYAIIITVIILPSFYLNGEAAFRRNLAIYGSFKAMKNAIFGKMWRTGETIPWGFVEMRNQIFHSSGNG